MRKNLGRYLIVLCSLPLALCLGCADGPFRWVLYHSEWEQDEQYGPTFYSQMEEMRSVRSDAAGYSPAEQANLAAQLTQRLAESSDSVYRREMVRTLGELSVPEASESLRRAIKDDDSKVRIAACEAWGHRRDEEALQILAEVVRSDSELDVRMAATRELAAFSHPDAVRALGVALDDADPALQHRAIQSLRNVTGQDFGNSVAAWRQFVHDGTVPQVAPPSIADRMRDLL